MYSGGKVYICDSLSDYAAASMIIHEAAHAAGKGEYPAYARQVGFANELLQRAQEGKLMITGEMARLLAITDQWGNIVDEYDGMTVDRAAILAFLANPKNGYIGVTKILELKNPKLVSL